MYQGKLLVCFSSLLLVIQLSRAEDPGTLHADRTWVASATGAVSYALGAPLTYVSIGTSIAAVHGGDLSEGQIAAIAISGIVLNNGGLTASCIAAHRATKHLEPSDPLRLAARKCRRNYGRGGVAAFGSAALCSLGALIAGQSGTDGFVIIQPFLIGGAGLLVVRDIFWSRAAVGAVRVTNEARRLARRPLVAVSPAFSPSGSIGACAAIRF